MQIPLVLVRMAHKIALVILISGDGFNCEGASDSRHDFHFVKQVLD